VVREAHQERILEERVRFLICRGATPTTIPREKAKFIDKNDGGKGETKKRKRERNGNQIDASEEE